jgi:hypothetical protein
MKLKSNSERGFEPDPSIATTRRRSRPILILACMAAIAAMSAAAQTVNEPITAPPPMHSILLPAANRPLDPNQVMEMRQKNEKGKDFTAANAERRKQIADDTAKLLKLATDLKAEVDKTTKDTLSLGVIRRADEIERLAHSVKEKMKLSVGGS